MTAPLVLFFRTYSIAPRKRDAAQERLSETGFIVLDDSQRPRYREFFEILAGWHVETFDFGTMQTTLFSRTPAQTRGRKESKTVTAA